MMTRICGTSNKAQEAISQLTNGHGPYPSWDDALADYLYWGLAATAVSSLTERDLERILFSSHEALQTGFTAKGGNLPLTMTTATTTVRALANSQGNRKSSGGRRR